MEENSELPKIGAGIAKGIKAAFRGWCRPFRARNSVGDGTQGAALGYRVMPKHGGTLTNEFFERQLEKIREIRLSELLVLGLPVKAVTFSNQHILKWEPYGDLRSISIFPGHEGIDYIYVMTTTK